MNPKVAFPAQNTLGEGPLWSVREQALYWVDILKPALYRWEPANGNFQSWPMPADIGAMCLRASGGAVVALQNGLHFFDFESGKEKLMECPLFTF